MLDKFVSLDQFLTFMYYNTQTNQYDTMFCSVAEFLNCFCDFSQLEVIEIKKSYGHKKDNIEIKKE